MTFYIGKDNSSDTLNYDYYEGDYGVEVEDEVLDCVYRVREKIPFKGDVLYQIDPYSDVVIPLKELQQIVDTINYVLKASLLKNCREDDAEDELRALSEISLSAIRQGKNLVSFGD
ncbi:MAG: hypothetical protein UE295_00920 [Acutalibacteraceae bacterium]|nr:hypothetical protein [Acutalibacteraceae bacterium]